MSMVLTRAAAAAKATAVPAAHSPVQNTTSHQSPVQSTEMQPPKTADGHYIVVHGRRWRATDPLVPADVEAELKRFLGRARYALRKKSGSDNEDENLIRRRVGLAKLGLGERGQPVWWEDTDAGRTARWEGALSELRDLDATS